MSDLFLFDGEKIREMAELEAPPESLVEAIKQLFGLHLADQLEIDLKIIEKRRAKQIKELGLDEAVLDKIDERLKAHRATKRQLLTQKEEAEYQLEQALSKNTFIKNQFIAQGASLTERQSELEKSMHLCNAEINALKGQLNDLVGGELPFALIFPLLEESLSQAKLEADDSLKTVVAEHFESFVEEFSLLIGTLKLPATKSDKLHRFLEDNLKSLKQPPSDHWLGCDSKDVFELERLLSEAQSALNSKDKLLQELAVLKEKRNDIEIQLAGAAVPEQYERLKQESQIAEDTLVKARVQVELLKSQLDREQRQIDQCVREAEEYVDTHIELQNSRHIIGAAEKARGTIEKYRDVLLSKRVGELEQELTLCSRFLLHKSDLIHRVQVSKKDFSLSIFDASGNLIPKHRLSAGEQQLLVTSYLWALAKLSKLKIPVCVDTPLGRLDQEHRESVIAKYFPHASHQVLVFSTNTELNEDNINSLRNLKVIQREYLLQNHKSSSQVYAGYFW
jgi:DNA sulfur modification protein DndD